MHIRELEAAVNAMRRDALRRAIDASPEMPRMLGGRLCLDFANTVDLRHGEHPREYLGQYPDLVAWARYAGVLTVDEALDLLGAAARDPDSALRTYRRAIALREATYRIFSAIADVRQPPESVLGVLNMELTRAMARARLVVRGESLTWAWTRDDEALDRMLWPVVWSAAELLTSDELDRVKECPGADGCGWLFLDTSKNRSRQWCAMDGCGNRAKARRHYARTRAASTQ